MARYYKAIKRVQLIRLIISAILLCFVVYSIIWIFNNLESEVAVSLVVGVATVTGALWSTRSARLKDRELQIQSQQAVRKEEVIGRFMDALWTIFQDNFKSESVKLEYMQKTMRDIMVNGSLWLSDETLKTFVDYRLSAQGKTDETEMMRHLAKMMLGFRSDLGHKNTNLSEKNILDVFLNETDTIFK